jgi:hypothetical protein
MSEDKSGSEEFEEQDEGSPKGVKERFYRYAVPAVVVLLLAIAILGTNAVDTSISGAIISQVSSECRDEVNALEVENSQLKDTLSTEKQALIIEKNNLELENVKLRNMAEKLEDQVDLYSDILSSLDGEDLDTVTTPFGFKITWDKYVIAKPGQDTFWSAEIENTGPTVRGFTLDLKMKSAHNDAFEKEPAVIGSLTLKAHNSGSLNVKLTPEDEGYGIFGIYVNNNYVGDLLVFAF